MDNAAFNETWYVFNMSDMCSSKQPEYVMLKTLDTPCVKYVPEKSLEDYEDQEAYDQILRDRLRQENELRVKAEQDNERLRKALKALVVGTYHELCEGHDSYQCKQCSMHHSDGECIVTDVMDFFGDDDVIDLLVPANHREDEDA